MNKYHLQDQFLDFFFGLTQAKSFYLTGGTALDRKTLIDFYNQLAKEVLLLIKPK